MNAWYCPYDGTTLRQLETHHHFAKHGGCDTCGHVYVLWGDSMSLCNTPEKCVFMPWRTIKKEIEKPEIVQPGPFGGGLV